MPSLLDLAIRSKGSTVVRSAKAELDELKKRPFPGWEEVAFLRALKDQLETLLTDKERELKKTAKAIFIDEGCRLKQKPDSLDVKDGVADGKFIVGKRKSTQALTEAMIAAFEKHNISMTYSKIEERLLVFNTKYLDDQKLMNDIGNKLNSIKGLPKDLIIEDRGAPVTTKTSLDEVCRLPKEIATELFDYVANISIKSNVKFPKDATSPQKVFKFLSQKVAKAFQ